MQETTTRTYQQEVLRGRMALPIVIWLVLVSTALACTGGVRIVGYRMSGLTWVVPLAFSRSLHA